MNSFLTEAVLVKLQLENVTTLRERKEQKSFMKDDG